MRSQQRSHLLSMTMSSSDQVQAEVPSRELGVHQQRLQYIFANRRLRANLAAEGFSVFLIEAGGDSSNDIAERIPSLYVSFQLASSLH
jgi:hypothetical protein